MHPSVQGGGTKSVLVSVIIPALNESENIARCVECARRDYASSEVEIIVVDGGSTDGTPEMVPHGVRVTRSSRGRAVQQNHGAGVSHGEILLFCHADTQLPAGWRDAVIEALRRDEVSGGAFQRRYEPAWGLVLFLLNRVHNFGHWFFVHGDRCQFMTRAMFDEVGGFQELPLMEDLEMSRTLAKKGKIRMVGPRVVSSSRRLMENGVLRQGLLSIWYCFRYIYLGATAEDIARLYRSSRERENEGPDGIRYRGRAGTR